MDQNDTHHQINHTAEHILTQAMHRLYGPDQVIMAMGPAIKDGFYFDFELAQGATISEADFPKIEKEMRKIINQNLPVTSRQISVPEARKLFEGNPYKQEWLDEIEAKNEPATVYWTGDEFVDLCAGPHVASTGEVKAFKLLSVAGAYWHGDEKNKMLTRIYGTAYESDEALKDHLHRLEEARRRDHRKLGRELDLFTFSPLIGSGLPLYTQRGAFIRQALTGYVEAVQSAQGYMQVWTPQIAKAELFRTSGHYEKYKDDMFQVISHHSDEEFYLKPMNCPQHTQIYAAKPRSYRDLPLRMTDFAMLYRDEKPGELNGLARVRSFSQDDCHIFCREDQVNEEIDRALTMTKEIMDTFGFTYRYRLSTRDPNQPDKYLGDPAMWDKVENWAVEIMQRNQIDYYDGPGEAAFYAPKMDLMATDALGREWQLSTVQIDYVMPERFGLTYTDTDGTEKSPIMIHRAIVGSPERFMMILIEHFAGAFPLWLAPTQAVIIPIGQDQAVEAKRVFETLKEQGIRAELWDQADSLPKRIRTAEKQKVPYMLIIGAKEVETNSVSVRARGQQDLGTMTPDQFLARARQLLETKSLEL
jgi:threonyl-tRNA synthetase